MHAVQRNEKRQDDQNMKAKVGNDCGTIYDKNMDYRRGKCSHIMNNKAKNEHAILFYVNKVRRWDEKKTNIKVYFVSQLESKPFLI